MALTSLTKRVLRAARRELVGLTSPPSPQLRMGFTRFAELAPPAMPLGYGLRTFRQGDQDAWLAVLSTGGFGTWNRDRLDRLMAGDQGRLPLAGVLFATQDDVPVGAACTILHPNQHDEVAELGWVAVHPSHHGHGIGLQLCRAVLRFVRDSGHSYAYLLTDDFRVPALKTYVRAGFVPEMNHATHAAWWGTHLQDLQDGARR